MNKFAFHKMDEVKGIIPFYKLEMDESILLNEFENEIANNSKYLSQFRAALSWMEEVANKKTIPDTKFKPLDRGKEATGVFEFKTKNLRIYGMSLPGGKIIIFGGYKNNKQNKNIKRAKRIANEIIDLKLTPNEKTRITKES